MPKQNSIVILNKNYRLNDNRPILKALEQSKFIYIVLFLDVNKFRKKNKNRSILRCIFEIDCIVDLNNQLNAHNSRLIVFPKIKIEAHIEKLLRFDKNINKIFIANTVLPEYFLMTYNFRYFCNKYRNKKIKLIEIVDYGILKKPAKTINGKLYKSKSAMLKAIKKRRRKFLRITPNNIKPKHRRQFGRKFNNKKFYGELDINKLEKRFKNKYSTEITQMRYRGGEANAKCILFSKKKRFLHSYLEFGCISWRQYWQYISEKEKDNVLERFFWVNIRNNILWEKKQQIPKYRLQTRILNKIGKETVFAGKTGHILFDFLIAKLKTTGYLTERERNLIGNFIIESGNDYSLYLRIMEKYLIDFNFIITTIKWSEIVSERKKIEFRHETEKLNPKVVRLLLPTLSNVPNYAIKNWYNESKKYSYPNPA